MNDLIEINNIISLTFGFIIFIIGFKFIKNKSLIIKVTGIIYMISFILNISFTNLFPQQLEVSTFAAIYFSIVTLLILNLINKSNLLLKYNVNWNTPTVLLYVFILVTSLIVIIQKFTFVIDILNSDNLQYLRHLHYQGESFIETNLLLNYASIIAGWFRIPFLLLTLSLIKTKFSRFVIYLIIISFLPLIFSAILTISRGMLVLVFIDVFIIYNYLKVNHENIFIRFKKTSLVNIPLLFLFTLIIFFLINVTESRFSEETGSLSMLKYFSHSIYFFSSSVVEIDNLFWGSFSFNTLFENGLGLDDLNLKTDTGFFTYLGAFYIDFGYAGGFILLFFLFLLLYPFNFFNQNKISKSMLLFVSAEQFLIGNFVWGMNIGFSFLLWFLVSRILIFFNN